jgi:hypothetical protein
MDGVLQALIPAIAALVTEGVKRLAPALPKWLIPIFASVLGAAAQALATGAVTETAAMTGLAAVGLREIVDQARKATR